MGRDQHRFGPVRPSKPSDYSSNPAPSYYGPTSPSDPRTARPAPPVRRTAAAAAFTVLAVFLTCCCAAAVLAIGLFGSLEETGTSGSDGTASWGDPGDRTGTTGAPDPRWDDFSPAPYDRAVYVQPTDRQLALVREIHSALFPDLAIVDVVCEAGHFDGETYWNDTLYVTASSDAAAGARIAYTLYIETEEAWKAGASYDPESLDSRYVLATTSDDTEYVYDQAHLGELVDRPADDELIALMTQVHQDFPGAVIDAATVRDGQGRVSITRWEAYPAGDEGFDLTYVGGGGPWVFASLEEW